MRFIPTGPDSSVMDTEKRLATYITHQRVHGFSKWMILDRVSRTPIGDSGLIVLPDSRQIDLGFRIMKAHWGSGFASEIAAAWIRAAVVDFVLERLTAFAHPQNAASVRVPQKAGFRASGREQIMGMVVDTFVLGAADFHSRDGCEAPPL
jgi:RimJ/RimL family protein N-acetyltransferase